MRASLHTAHAERAALEERVSRMQLECEQKDAQVRSLRASNDDLSERADVATKLQQVILHVCMYVCIHLRFQDKCMYFEVCVYQRSFCDCYMIHVYGMLCMYTHSRRQSGPFLWAEKTSLSSWRRSDSRTSWTGPSYRRR